MKWHSRDMWPPCGCAVAPASGRVGPKRSLEPPETSGWSSPGIQSQKQSRLLPVGAQNHWAPAWLLLDQGDPGHTRLIGFQAMYFFSDKAPHPAQRDQCGQVNTISPHQGHPDKEMRMSVSAPDNRLDGGSPRPPALAGSVTCVHPSLGGPLPCSQSAVTSAVKSSEKYRDAHCAVFVFFV